MMGTGPDALTVDQVLARDGLRCVRCGRRIDMGDFSIHHRRPRKMGGTRDETINRCDNLVTLCGTGTTGCHGWVESHRAAAYALGLLVHSHHFSWAVPIITHRGPRELTRDGQSIPTDKPIDQ